MERSAPSPRRAALWAAAAALPRLWLAARTAYLWDERGETFPFVEAIHWSRAGFHALMGASEHPFLYPALARLSTLLLGANAWGYRLPSVLAGSLTVGLLYWLVRSWSSEGAAGWAAALLAVNEYHAGVSSEATELSFYLLFSLAAVCCFSEFMRRQKEGSLYGAAVLAGAAYLCHENAVLALPAFFAVLLTRPYRRWLTRAAPWTALALFVLVISPDLLYDRLFPTPQPTDLLEHARRFGGVGLSPEPLLLFIRRPLLALWPSIPDNAGDYASTGWPLGLLLLGSAAALFLRPATDGLDVLLRALFAATFGFFSLVKAPSAAAAGSLDTASWYWAHFSVLVCCAAAGRLLERLPGRLRRPGWALAGAVGLLAAGDVFVLRAGLPAYDLRSKLTVCRAAEGPCVVAPEVDACPTCAPDASARFEGKVLQAPFEQRWERVYRPFAGARPGPAGSAVLPPEPGRYRLAFRVVRPGWEGPLSWAAAVVRPPQAASR